MNLSENILTAAASLSESKQLEALDFIEHLKSKIETTRTWNNFSVATAMRDMENEDSNYLLTDLKETF